MVNFRYVANFTFFTLYLSLSWYFHSSAISYDSKPDTTSDYLSSDDVDDYHSDSGSHKGGDMRYKGNYIPSKTFHKLRRSMDRRSAEPDQNVYAGKEKRGKKK